MTCGMATLETRHALSAQIRQPINTIFLALVAPVRTDNNDIFAGLVCDIAHQPTVFKIH